MLSTRSAALAVSLLSLAAHAAEPTRGEKALRASFYLNTVPTLVELVDDMKKDVLDALELDAKKRAAAERALKEHWSEQRLYANAAAALEKAVPADSLDAALKTMTPEIQAMVKAGITENATPQQAQQWMTEAKKHPDAVARRAIATRIARPMPQAAQFKELCGQVAADVAQVATGNDEARAGLKDSLLEGLAPALAAMEQKDVMEVSVVLAYRAATTPQLKAFADALDSEAGTKLQIAAPVSLITGAQKSRADIVAQLKKDFGKGGAAKKK
jgi:hypothetical protein